MIEVRPVSDVPDTTLMCQLEGTREMQKMRRFPTCGYENLMPDLLSGSGGTEGKSEALPNLFRRE